MAPVRSRKDCPQFEQAGMGAELCDPCEAPGDPGGDETGGCHQRRGSPRPTGGNVERSETKGVKTLGFEPGFRAK